ncbi:MAG: HEAT repeat domain-containing protein [Anaerolineae bacterium]|nr:HEAT repeat domain-containing protein [Anaerolineae bacterium]
MSISQQSLRLLNRLFNVRTSEWPRLLLLYLMYLVFFTGTVWAEIILETSFLQQVGVEILPWFFIVRAIAAIVAFAVYTAFADRVANDKLLIAFLLFGAMVILSGLGLLGLGLIIIAYPLLYLLIFVPFDEIFVTHWYTYTNDFYDTRSAKRLIPVLSTAGRVGGIVAGLTIPVLTGFISSTAIIVVWLCSLLFMALLAWLMPYLLKEGRVTDKQPGIAATYRGASPTGKRTSYFDNLREGYQYVSSSSFLRWVALATAVLIVLLVFFQDQTWRILAHEFATEAEITRFFGNVAWITNLIILPFQLFFLSRIIGRIGVGNANLIFPAGLFLIAGGLIFRPVIPTAALAHFGRTNFYGAIGYPIDSLLYNAVPLRVKGRARAFVGGFIVPLGSLVGGLLLLWPLVSSTGLAWSFIAVLAITYLVSAVIIRRKYRLALIQMLEQEDYSFLLSQNATNLIVTDPATLNELQKKLDESTDYDLKIFIAQLISQIGGMQAVSILGQAARTTTDTRTRVAIIDVLVAADTRGPEIRELYTHFLADSDGDVRRAAMVGLEQLISPHDERLLAIALSVLPDADVEVRAKAISMLLQTDDPAYRAPALEALNEFLHHQDPRQRARGVQVLRRVGEVQFIEHLVKYLADPADEVRLEAALAIEALAQTKIPDSTAKLILDSINLFLHDPVQRIRQAGLVVIGRLDAYESYLVLVRALADPSLAVRTTAVEVLVQLGKAAVPIVHPQLDAADSQLRKMAAIILSRINQREYGPLIEAQISGNLLAIYRNYGHLAALAPCAEYRGGVVLQSAIREQNRQLVAEIFYLLKAIHDADAIDTIAESFHSEAARIRANAAEALETLTSPQTAGLISPLFEPDLAPTQLVEVAQAAWEMRHPDTSQVMAQLITDADAPHLRAITTFVLGEMGAALAANGDKKQEEVAQRQEERRPRRLRSAPDLFGALMDNDEVSEVQSPEPAVESIQPPSSGPTPEVENKPFTLVEIQGLLENSFNDPEVEVRLAAQAAERLMAGFSITDLAKEEDIVLSAIEKIIFLKEVPFFQEMTVDQLKVLANVCEEELFEEDQWIFHQSDAGGALYVIVSGRVGIEQEKRKGSYARLATLGPRSYFGEMSLFDNSLRSAGAIALQDTLTLSLRREPLIALARQYPDLSLELIHVLSERLRQANNRVAELTRTRPRELQKLYDQLD